MAKPVTLGERFEAALLNNPITNYAVDHPAVIAVAPVAAVACGTVPLACGAGISLIACNTVSDHEALEGESEAESEGEVATPEGAESESESESEGEAGRIETVDEPYTFPFQANDSYVDAGGNQWGLSEDGERFFRCGSSCVEFSVADCSTGVDFTGRRMRPADSSHQINIVDAERRNGAQTVGYQVIQDNGQTAFSEEPICWDDTETCLTEIDDAVFSGGTIYFSGTATARGSTKQAVVGLPFPNWPNVTGSDGIIFTYLNDAENISTITLVGGYLAVLDGRRIFPVEIAGIPESNDNTQYTPIELGGQPVRDKIIPLDNSHAVVAVGNDLLILDISSGEVEKTITIGETNITDLAAIGGTVYILQDSNVLRVNPLENNPEETETTCASSVYATRIESGGDKLFLINDQTSQEIEFPADGCGTQQ